MFHENRMDDSIKMEYTVTLWCMKVYDKIRFYRISSKMALYTVALIEYYAFFGLFCLVTKWIVPLFGVNPFMV
jgi:hypothetical protein